MTDANDAAVDWRTKYEQLKHEHELLRELQDEHEKTEAFLEEALRNTEQEADQREKELQQAQERVQQLEEALTSANADLELLERQAMSSSTVEARLERTEHMLATVRRESEDRMRRSAEEIERLQVKLQAATEEAAMHKENVRHFETQITHLEHQSRVYKGWWDYWEEKHDSAVENAEILETELHDMNQKHAELSRKLHEEVFELRSARNVHSERLRAALEREERDGTGNIVRTPSGRLLRRVTSESALLSGRLPSKSEYVSPEEAARIAAESGGGGGADDGPPSSGRSRGATFAAPKRSKTLRHLRSSSSIPEVNASDSDDSDLFEHSSSHSKPPAGIPALRIGSSGGGGGDSGGGGGSSKKSPFSRPKRDADGAVVVPRLNLTDIPVEPERSDSESYTYSGKDYTDEQSSRRSGGGRDGKHTRGGTATRTDTQIPTTVGIGGPQRRCCGSVTLGNTCVIS